MPSPTAVTTTKYTDQKPGTSGLRKKVTVFQQPHYLANFVQATFDALAAPGAEGIPSVLVVGGDGRYYCPEAAQLIVKIAAANGVKRVWVGQNALLSTPAVSAIVREREGGFVAKGAFILTASHNPGGPTEDFGIKYNAANGGPAPEKLTSAIFDLTLAIDQYKICTEIPEIDLSTCGTTKVDDDFSVDVIDSTEDHVKLLSKVFDITALKTLVQRPNFTFLFDGMHGVAGPYAKKMFCEVLGAAESNLINCEPKTDFGKGHPDPNLTYAPQLVKAMGLTSDGVSAKEQPANVPDFGAASDGDADRNMILGNNFFVTPSDSVAVIAAQSQCIPFFAQAGGIKSVARSMPTSGALDRVATGLGIPLFEVPTGWKFFGNLMDSKDVYNKAEYNPLICGEESFGTGSNHVREKDGLWAVLAWMSVLAAHNQDAAKPFVSIKEIVTAHWEKFGRNYYRRYDYEGVETEGANKLMDAMRAMKPAEVPKLGNAECKSVDDFEYLDPVDGSVSKKQGIRVLYVDGSRFVFRLSGTGSVGATIRLYMEQYMNAEDVKAQVKAGTLPECGAALEALSKISVETSKIEAFTGRKEPTVIT